MLQHKQRPRLDLDGFSYVRDRITSDKIYWRCIKYKSDHCHGRLHTCLESKTILKHPSDHICKFDATENQVRQFSQQVTARALNTQENPISRQHQVTNPNASSKQPDRQGTQRPPISICSNATHPQSSPGTIPPVRYWPCDDRIIILASPEQLHVLQTSQDFLVDGTFKVVPEIFYQLFIIHAVYCQHTVPVVYALLRRKGAGAYTHLFDEIVKIAPNWLPASSLGHQAQYQTDSTFVHNIHKIAALAFHDPNSALNGFESLCERLDDQYDNILDYFEETYIDKVRSNRVRRKPLFEVNF
ncbi:unnamed protein product [Rotaria socialis]|nr:unnamed protein product [Rotaria socialis]